MKHAWAIACMAGLLLFAWPGAFIMAQEQPRMTLNEVPRMSQEDLKARLGRDDLVVIDVRLPGQLRPGEPMIRGAVVENPKDVHNWMHKYPRSKTLVLYCA